ncbi:hypothetical protein N836_03725 [Leptolyngbya sp. Heron Island J]|nr:hypothetical protein N836_03725 [Leptolyngbya sp. Heron Island J]
MAILMAKPVVWQLAYTDIPSLVNQLSEYLDSWLSASS